ncbi:MAG: hypothetical protein Kow00129_11130 [Thermoleophilia bacterium]
MALGCVGQSRPDCPFRAALAGTAADTYHSDFGSAQRVALAPSARTIESPTGGEGAAPRGAAPAPDTGGTTKAGYAAFFTSEM